LERLISVLRGRSLEIALLTAFLGLVLGLWSPSVFKALKQTLPVAIFLMIFQPMYALDFNAARRKGLKGRAKFLALVTVFYTLVFPLMTYAYFTAMTGVVSARMSLILAGAVLVALAPVAMPAPAFVGIAGGDVELSLLSVVWTFALSFIVMPYYAYMILHRVVHVPLPLILKALLLYIAAPFALGQTLRFIVLRTSKTLMPKVNKLLLAVSLLALYYLITVVFGASSRIIASSSLEVAAITGSLFAYFGSRFGLAYAIGKLTKMSYREVVPLVYAATGNGAIGIALSLSAFGPLALTGAVLAGPLVLVILMTVCLKLAVRRG